MKNWILLTAALLCLPVCAEEKPNIVVFLVDDMGMMDSSLPFLTDSKGKPKKYPLNEWFRTPNMERLAEKGVRFNNFYVQSVCSPTRTSILTGQNATRHRTTNWIAPRGNNRGVFGPPEWNWTGLTRNDVTLPRVLSAAGYRTIHVGKGHFGHLDSEGADPKNLGFDINIGGSAWGQPGSYRGEDHYGNLPRPGKKITSHEVPHLEAYHGTKTHLSEALTLEANKAISAAVKAEMPFFLYFAHYAVHSPFQSDPRFAEHYENSNKSKAEKAYATLIEGMDQSLGKLLDHLEEVGVAENTLVLFLGDNGSDNPAGNQNDIACAVPLRGKKGSHYEGGMRVPFIMAWAKPTPSQLVPMQAGAILPQVASVLDLWPTISSLAGAENPENHVLDGSSLLDWTLTGVLRGAILDSNGEAPQKFFLMHFPHEHRSNYFTTFRKGDWKVVYHYQPKEVNPDKRYELFNLANDPSESKNLVEQEPAQLKRMMTEMVTQLAKEGALYPIDKDGRELQPIVPE